MCAAAAAHVLAVEDDGAVRGFLCRALESGGYVPLPVRTGEEALSALRSSDLAAALIDGILPDMHGVRLAREMLNDPASARTAICFVTGAIRESVPAVAGMTALSKPLRLSELLSTLDALMRWREEGSVAAARLEALQTLEQGFLVGP